MEDLEKMLTKISESSKTAKLWVMCFIRPILTINTHPLSGLEPMTSCLLGKRSNS